MTKGSSYKIGKTLKSRNSKFKTFKSPLSIVINFNCSITKVRVDTNLYGLKIGDIFFLVPKDAKIISESEWNLIIDTIKKDEEAFNNKMENMKEKKKNILKNIEKIIND